MDQAEAGRMRAALLAAVKMYRTDPRFAAVVAGVMADRRLTDPRDVERFTDKSAVDAVMHALTRTCHDDAEIRTLRAKRDRYIGIAKKALLFAPAPMILARATNQG